MGNVQLNCKETLTRSQKHLRAMLVEARKMRMRNPEDFTFFGIAIDVGVFSSDGVEIAESTTLDIETGIVLLEAAQRIVDERLRGFDRPKPPLRSTDKAAE
jgi:hypothetical protein